ncbi:hypothetical protein F5Y17DRAFT_12772 [Xylariaceae sp. FL0594]|nr:hypothetical protein F5Y17DRAFT_12772 [Xylariaceae sp. FL0594]
MPRGRPKVIVAPCPHCGKQFKRQEHLVRHERTHTRETPFSCDCGRRFARQDLLARHVRLLHPPFQQPVPVPVPEPEPEPEAVPVPVLEPVPEPVPGPRTEADAAQDMMGASDDFCLDDCDLFWDQDFVSHAERLFGVDPVAGLFESLSPPPQSRPRARLEEEVEAEASQKTSFGQFSSGLPPLDLVEDDSVSNDANDAELGSPDRQTPWCISGPVFEKLCEEMRSYAPILPLECSVPTHNTLSRGLEMYMRCTHKYLPFIHIPTFNIAKRPIELPLAMAALGLLYRVEHNKAYNLYFMARIIWSERSRREKYQAASDILRRLDPPAGLATLASDDCEKLHKIQTLVLLVSFASWGSARIRGDAFAMAGELAALAREYHVPADHSGWASWVMSEERSRTVFAAYVLTNLQSITFNNPPLILNHEVKYLPLPDYTQRWAAENALQWNKAPRRPSWVFSKALDQLFRGKAFSKEDGVSSFSSYLLILGLLQQFCLHRHSSIDVAPSDPAVATSETALRAWQVSWEMVDEATLDPHSATSPFSLASTSLLRLGFIRLNVEHEDCRGTLWRGSRAPLIEDQALERSLHVDRAVLYAAHGLSMLVRLGVSYMATTKTSIWSIEHTVCSVESALLLKQWLANVSRVIASAGTGGLRRSEKKLLGIITAIIQETDFSNILNLPKENPSRYQHMAATVISLWASFFEGPHVLEIDDDVSSRLRSLAESILS